jgi:AcrR family transcriptional regulator
MHELRTAPRQRRSQKSIDAILDAAEWLIHENGQVNFTANELASAAGMSIGRVYYWFPDIPSVVAALVERGVHRMVEEFRGVVEVSRDDDTSVVLERGVSALCSFIDKNPATVALCLTGGHQGPGKLLFDRMFELSSALIHARVPAAPDEEVVLVARTAVGITLGMLRGYTDAGEFRDLVRQELSYVLSTWLYTRYPPAGDRAWTDPSFPMRPSRLPAPIGTGLVPVYPALSPEVG